MFPVREADFALYLQHVGDSTASKSSVEEAVNPIGWVQQLDGFPPVAESPLVRMVLAMPAGQTEGSQGAHVQ